MVPIFNLRFIATNFYASHCHRRTTTPTSL